MLVFLVLSNNLLVLLPYTFIPMLESSISMVLSNQCMLFSWESSCFSFTPGSALRINTACLTGRHHYQYRLSFLIIVHCIDCCQRRVEGLFVSVVHFNCLNDVASHLPACDGRSVVRWIHLLREVLWRRNIFKRSCHPQSRCSAGTEGRSLAQSGTGSIHCSRISLHSYTLPDASSSRMQGRRIGRGDCGNSPPHGGNVSHVTCWRGNGPAGESPPSP